MYAGPPKWFLRSHFEQKFRVKKSDLCNGINRQRQNEGHNFLFFSFTIIILLGILSALHVSKDTKENINEGSVFKTMFCILLRFNPGLLSHECH